MGKIREFFYLLAIAVLISLSMIFIGAAFREEYPLWKNQKILEDLRSDVKAEETRHRLGKIKKNKSRHCWMDKSSGNQD